MRIKWRFFFCIFSFFLCVSLVANRIHFNWQCFFLFSWLVFIFFHLFVVCFDWVHIFVRDFQLIVQQININRYNVLRSFCSMWIKANCEFIERIFHWNARKIIDFYWSTIGVDRRTDSIFLVLDANLVVDTSKVGTYSLTLFFFFFHLGFDVFGHNLNIFDEFALFFLLPFDKILCWISMNSLILIFPSLLPFSSSESNRFASKWSRNLN